MRLHLPTSTPAELALPSGASPATVRTGTSTDALVRQLDAPEIRAQLPRLIRPETATCLQFATDLSGSMSAGNDTIGLRHECLLVLLEHLVACAGGRDAGWSVELRSFDLDSTLDTPCLPARRRSLRAWREALLRPPGGGISSLTAALRDAEQVHADARRVLVIFSDFELSDPPDTLHRLAASNAHDVIACVFRSPVPTVLEDAPGVHTIHVDPATTTPSALCMQIADRLAAL